MSYTFHVNDAVRTAAREAAFGYLMSRPLLRNMVLEEMARYVLVPVSLCCLLSFPMIYLFVCVTASGTSLYASHTLYCVIRCSMVVSLPMTAEVHVLVGIEMLSEAMNTCADPKWINA